MYLITHRMKNWTIHFVYSNRSQTTHYTKTCISDLVFIPCNFDELKHLHLSFCWISTSNRASISQQLLAVQRQPICSDYTKSFTLNTPFHLAWRHQFVFKPNWVLYSSQIESCIQAKLNVVIKPNCLGLYGNASRRWLHTCSCDDESHVFMLLKHKYIIYFLSIILGHFNYSM